MSTPGDFTISVDAIALQRAEEVARSVFRDWKWTEGGGHKHISTELKLGQVAMDVNREILPPLALALMFFGGELPNELIAKLRNRTQTRDTLFELWCLGMFGQRCKVEYEPRLSNGKVPDLCVHAGRKLYVECKSHHFMDSVYWSRFQKAASLIGQQVGGSPLQKKAWGQDLRVEVYPDMSPNSNDLLRLGETVQTEAIDEFVTPGRASPAQRSVRADVKKAISYQFSGSNSVFGFTVTANERFTNERP